MGIRKVIPLTDSPENPNSNPGPSCCQPSALLTEVRVVVSPVKRERERGGGGGGGGR